MKHTPGKWEILPEEVGRSYIRIRGTFLGGRYKIANVLSVNYEGNGGFINKEMDEVRANARLIAAAPEMLDCLIRAYNIVRLDDKMRLSCELFKQAIEKATGQSISDIIATGEGE